MNCLHSAVCKRLQYFSLLRRQINELHHHHYYPLFIFLYNKGSLHSKLHKKMIPSSTSQQRSPIVLPNRLETVLEKIYSKHKCPPINDESRQRLSSIPEELAFDLLRTAFNSPPEMSSLGRFIASKLAVTVTSSRK